MAESGGHEDVIDLDDISTVGSDEARTAGDAKAGGSGFDDDWDFSAAEGDSAAAAGSGAGVGAAYATNMEMTRMTRLQRLATGTGPRARIVHRSHALPEASRSGQPAPVAARSDVRVAARVAPAGEPVDAPAPAEASRDPSEGTSHTAKRDAGDARVAKTSTPGSLSFFETMFSRGRKADVTTLHLVCTCTPNGRDRHCRIHVRTYDTPHGTTEGVSGKRRMYRKKIDEEAAKTFLAENKRRAVYMDIAATLQSDEIAHAAEMEELQGVCKDAHARRACVVDLWHAREESAHGDTAVALPAKTYEILKDHQLQGIQFLWKNVVVVERRARQRAEAKATAAAAAAAAAVNLAAVRGEDEDADGDEAPVDMGCILAHSMGLGKTAQIVLFLHLLIKAGVVRSALILAPKSTMSNWEAEFARWGALSGLPEQVPFFELVSEGNNLAGRLSVLKEWTRRGGALTLGYEAFGTLVGAYEGRSAVAHGAEALCDPGPDIVFCDEGHMLRNSAAAISRALGKLRTRRRVILTGTPLQNHLMEYFTMIDFIRPGYFKRQDFQRYFQAPVERGQRHNSTEDDVNLMKARSFILTKELEPFVQRKDQSILQAELPRKLEFIIYCPMSPLQKKVYSDLHDAYSRAPSTFHTGSGRSLLFFVSMMNKLSGHPDLLREHLFERKKDYDAGGRTHRGSFEWAYNSLLAMNYSPGSLLSSPKLMALLYIAEYCVKRREKLLVFSQFTKTLDFIQRYLGKLTQNQHIWRLDGSSSDKARAQALSEFQAHTNFGIFLISTRAGGAGINLNTAHKAVLYDVSFNPALDQQALFRLYRYGQKSRVEIYRLVADHTPESHIFSSCISKDWLAKKLVDNSVPSRVNVRGLGLDGVFASLDEMWEKEEEDSEEMTAKLDLEKRYCLERSPLVRHVHDQLARRALPVRKIFRYESLLLDDDAERAGLAESEAYEEYKKAGGPTSELYNLDITDGAATDFTFDFMDAHAPVVSMCDTFMDADLQLPMQGPPSRKRPRQQQTSGPDLESVLLRRMDR